MYNFLAEYEDITVHGEFEYALISGKGIGSNVCIGDFYGDPSCACIDTNRKWCVVGGKGLIVYYLKEPFESYQYDTETSQWKELFRDPEATIWVEEITQLDEETVKFITEDENDVYELNVNSMEYKKLK